MTVTKTTVISINPNDTLEYDWWVENEQKLKDEGYVLYDDSTAVWIAKLERGKIFALGKEER